MRDVVVYRVVDYGDIGMYRSREPLPFRYDIWRHPQPDLDDDLVVELSEKQLPDLDSGKLHYGFRSIKQLKVWINRKLDRRIMGQSGFVVKKFMVPSNMVARGETQVVFHMESATMIDTINIAEI